MATQFFAATPLQHLDEQEDKLNSNRVRQMSYLLNLDRFRGFWLRDVARQWVPQLALLGG